MAISEKFYQYVKDGDILGVHVSLKNTMLMDKTLKEFDEMLEYAKSVLRDRLFESHVGQLNENENAWDEDYLYTELEKLMNNFSKERVNHLRNVIFTLYPDAEVLPEYENDRKTSNSYNCNDSFVSCLANNKKVKTGLMVAGAASLAGGIIFKSRVLGVSGAALCGASFALDMYNKKRGQNNNG